MDWDTIYIFREYAYPEVISKVIGFNYTGSDVSDSQERKLLVKNKKVIYEETMNLNLFPKFGFKIRFNNLEHGPMTYLNFKGVIILIL